MPKKIFLAILFIGLIALIIFWMYAIFFFVTVPSPKHGGQYSEAFIDQPLYINPLLAPRGTFSDKALTRLVYSSLYAYDKDGILTGDIADHFERSEEDKLYTVHLREDVMWHDGESLTADDIIYTINTIKVVAYGAPSELRIALNNATVEKIDDFTVTFRLNEARADFLHILTFGILPEHVWHNVVPEQFQLTELNRKPLGSGPYAFVAIDADEAGTIKTYTLRAHQDYHKGEPRITKIIFHFFADKKQAVEAYKEGIVSGIIVDAPEDMASLQTFSQTQHAVLLPRYFALFFNQNKSVPLAFDEVRNALTYAVDRRTLTTEIIGAGAQPVYSAVLSEMNGYNAELQQPTVDYDEAKKRLEGKGWKVGKDGVRAKDGVRLNFTLFVSDVAQLVSVAEKIAIAWREIGVEVNVEVKDAKGEFAKVVQDREYDAILTAQPMRWDHAQMHALWHSTERKHPGKNYANMQDDTMDDALKKLQTETDHAKRSLLYDVVQKRILAEDPAVFLFAPGLIFEHVNSLKNVNIERINAPRDRFADVHEWYIKEKRVLR